MQPVQLIYCIIIIIFICLLGSYVSRAFQNLHTRHARDPTESINREKVIHRDYMLEIESAFRRNGTCLHLQETDRCCKTIKATEGSACGVVLSDVMLVMDIPEYDLQVLCDDAN